MHRAPAACDQLRVYFANDGKMVSSIMLMTERQCVAQRDPKALQPFEHNAAVWIGNAFDCVIALGCFSPGIDVQSATISHHKHQFCMPPRS